ncbi:hypothetical protein GGX14DRAFT_580724 [Mycena pura]|uniref:DUF7330 domain-containing protein n=1 Tax=Mycena pura TaxID=153505 RepID=A0AAD6XVK7_9AGAR|nr:hypothetical protein GGX14DRAFT_580724 [Mycena pura]
MPTTPESRLKDRATTTPENDSPPAYVPLGSQAATMSEQQLAPPTPPVTVKPTNFLFVKRDSGRTGIMGTYVIDPRIKVPQSMLPPLAEGQSEATRQNVFLHADDGCTGINVDLFVLGDANTKRSLNMFLESTNGYITARLHAASTARPPIHITAEATHSISLHLPRTFRGPVTVRNYSKRSSIRISEHLKAGMMPLSEANHTWRYFVGTPEGWTDESKWAGDEVTVCLNYRGSGDVTLQYDVEPRAADPSKGRCLVC